MHISRISNNLMNFQHTDLQKNNKAKASSPAFFASESKYSKSIYNDKASYIPFLGSKPVFVTNEGKTYSTTTLFDKEKIQARVKELAEQINKDYGIEEPLTVIVTLKGAVPFGEDLARYLKMPVKTEYIKASSYGHSIKSSGTVKGEYCSFKNLEGQNVLILEDIVDSGRTAKYLLDQVKKLEPKSVKFATLLDKKEARIVPVKIDYTGFDVGNQFVIGYGLDYGDKYRNLTSIVCRDECISGE